MTVLHKGETYRINRKFPDLAIGTVFTVVEPVVDYFDWLETLVSVDGVVKRVGYGVDNYCESVVV